MSFPKYEHYKDSGVEWLGEVPAHWNTPFFQRCVYVAEGQVNPEDDPYRSMILVAPNHVESGTGRLLLTETAAEQSAESGKYLCQPGDVIYSKIRPALRKACLSPDVCLCSADMYPLRGTNGLRNEFLFWFLLSDEFSAWAVLESDRVAMPKINRESLKAVRLVLPTEAEQMGIAQFLNAETTKLDALITEQRTLIDLLKEKRQAVISHAVTKGLDPRVPMKDSGVEWLGEVPAHWSVGAIGYKATVDSGSTPDRGNPDYWNGDIPWIKTGEINYVPIVEAEESITAAGLAGSSARLAKPGTLLMAMYGQGATRGRVAVLEISAAYNQACAAISFASDMQVHFAKYFFMAAYGYIRDDGNETSQMNLGTGVIRKMKITIPPISEQGDIVSKLDKEIELLENLTAEAESTIALLQERRSALISAAVTGKIDVRQAA